MSAPEWANRVYLGSCERMAEIPDASVHCTVTSPPYFGLRAYGDGEQIGHEATVAEYVARMVGVFREVRRVMRDDGTAWLNLGDSYAGSWGAQGLKPKDLIGVPWRVAFALQSDGWYLRDAIVWAKPNPMPSSVADRCTSSYEMVFMLAKSKTYFSDMEAVREDPKPENAGRMSAPSLHESHAEPGTRYVQNKKQYDEIKGANRRNIWTIGTTPYFGDHPAIMPRELATRCILIGCPPGGVILDPFMGSGTVAECAIGNGRNFVGYEINSEYHAEIANRLGLFGGAA